MKNKREVLVKLFLSTLYLSAFTFGGGYVIITLMKKKFVDDYHWIEENEMLDLVGIAQSSPGAIAVNLSSLAGYKTAGLPGAVVSCIASVLPALIILSVISAWYKSFSQNVLVNAVLKGMEAGAAALIADLILDMVQVIKNEKSRLLTAMVPAAFAASFFLNLNVALILLACCCVCVGEVWCADRKKGC